MNRGGFEALADGVLLLVLLLVGAEIVLALGRPPAVDPRAEGIRYAEDTRLALFRTTLDDLTYGFHGEPVRIPNGTSVETLLRLEVHLLGRDPGAYNFSAANARVLEVAARLVRPGWGLAVRGGPAGGPDLIRLPDGIDLPPEHYASHWTYPALDGGPEKTRLTVALWISPLR